MTIIEELNRQLRALREEGYTNAEIAGESVRQQQVNKLLNGKQRIEKTQFQTVLNLFPEVRRVLEEHFCSTGIGASVVNTVNGSNNHVEGTATLSPAPRADARLDAALDAVLADPDICDQCRLAVLRHIRAAARS